MGLFCEVLFQIPAGVELGGAQAQKRIVLGIFGEDVAQVVHDGNEIGFQAFDGVGDKKADGVDGLGRELAVAAQPDENRSGRMFILVDAAAGFQA